jgi:hypothetical protein
MFLYTVHMLNGMHVWVQNKNCAKTINFHLTSCNYMNMINLPVILSRYLMSKRTVFLSTKEVKCLGIMCLCLVISSSQGCLLLASYTLITSHFPLISDYSTSCSSVAKSFRGILKGTFILPFINT